MHHFQVHFERPGVLEGLVTMRTVRGLRLLMHVDHVVFQSLFRGESLIKVGRKVRKMGTDLNSLSRVCQPLLPVL
jgi:hypothetical protein